MGALFGPWASIQHKLGKDTWYWFGLLSMLPIGVLQTMAAVEQGPWWARSAEFLQTPLMNTLRWLRAPGDTLFALGAGCLAWFILGLKTGGSIERADAPVAEPRPEPLGAAAPAHAAMVRRR